MKHDTLGLVKCLDEPTNLSAHHALERGAVRCDYVNGDTTRSQGGRDLEADEASPRNHYMLGVLRFLDEKTTVRERPEIVHVGTVSARDREMDRIGAGGNQEGAERAFLAAFQKNLAPGNVQRRHACVQQEFYVLLCVKIR